MEMVAVGAQFPVQVFVKVLVVGVAPTIVQVHVEAVAGVVEIVTNYR